MPLVFVNFETHRDIYLRSKVNRKYWRAQGSEHTTLIGRTVQSLESVFFLSKESSKLVRNCIDKCICMLEKYSLLGKEFPRQRIMNEGRFKCSIEICFLFYCRSIDVCILYCQCILHNSELFMLYKLYKFPLKVLLS